MAAHWFIYEMGPDPTFFGGAWPAFIPLIYDTLFAFDPYALEKGEFKVVPWVAESYTVSEDGLVYDIKIRQGIKFHHTGNPLTAYDVEYMLNRAYFWPIENAYPLDIVKAQDLPIIMFKVINRTEVINDYEIKLYMNSFFPALTEYLASPWYGIVDSKEVEKHAVIGSGGLSDHGYTWLGKQSPATIDAGSGPYMVEKFILLQKYDLIRCLKYIG